VPVVDEVKGRVPEVYISLKPGILPNKQVHETVTSPIGAIIGKMARPERIHVVPDMPKTRSGKIMRRVLAAIPNRMNRGDISTLANPGISEQVLQLVQGRAVGRLRKGPEDSKRFGDQR
jgi:acetyl-CoA synthetase